MHHLIHGVDGDGVGAVLQRLAEPHWAYMDAHADRLVARGPTLSADGTCHTGSIHVVDTATTEDAQRIAFEEPYWLAGVYASVTVTRLDSARAGTMWDHPPPDAGSTSALVVVDWPARPRGSVLAEEQHALERLAGTDLVVFGGVLSSDDGAQSIGLVAAVDADLAQATALVCGVGLLGPSTSVTTRRWRRGGRAQSTADGS